MADNIMMDAINYVQENKLHKEEFENLETVEESLEYFFNMIGG